jgi:hypothetical protein
MDLTAPDRATRLAEAVAADPDGVIEQIAAKAGVTYREALDAVPGAYARVFPGSAFETLWTEMVGWGPILFIVHTTAGVFEIDTALTPGAFGRGYFNIHGDAPLHGHLAAGRCAAIYLVDRPFFGRRSLSVQFIDEDGTCMFKVFVRRDDKRELIPDQVARFEALKAR